VIAVDSSVVVAALAPWHAAHRPALSAKDQLAFLEKAVANGVRGGALYDALIAGTVAKHSAGVGGHLISADRRAEPTYEAMEVATYFVDPE
jgi:hypothetical protein